jgi:hypothetical protein
LQPLRGFVLLCLALPAFAQYAGPAILSRGEAPAAMSTPKDDFTFSLTLAAAYTNGLVGVTAPNAQGQLADQSSFGGGVILGVSGAHSWEHTHIGLDYSGTFRDYTQATFYSGLSQGLLLGATHQFSPYIAFSLRESAGMFSQFLPATVSLNSSIPFDPSQSYVPTTDFYDNRTIYNTTQASLTVQQSAQLSFDLGGTYFLNERRSSALYGAAGENAQGDIQYRLSPQATLGANYNFSHFSYTNSFGGADIHAAAFAASYRLSRWTEFSFFGGASRLQSSFEQTVPVDPAILAILCPSSSRARCPVTAGTVISNSTLWGPDFSARFSRSFQRGVAYVNAGESITPGNGLFLTSRAITASVGYGYSGLRGWSLNAAATYTSALSLGNVTGRYKDLMGMYSMSRQIVGPLSFVSSFNATRYRSASFTGYNRLIYTASVGIGFSSGNKPVRFF